MKKWIYIIIMSLLLLVVGALLSSCSEDNPCRHERVLSTVVAADCGHEGYTLHRCQDCGLEYKTDHIPSKGHTLVEQAVQPTCTEGGYTLYSCACGYSFQGGFLPPNGHSFTSTTISPTCTEQGYTEYTCACEYSYRAAYKKPMGHDLISTVVAPTCTEQGYTTYACTNCTYSYVTDYVEPTGHSFTATLTRPTSTENGKTEFVCACEYSYTVSILTTEVFGAYVNQTDVLAYGVDVSYHENVDWNVLREAGIDFVILRAGYSGTKDEKFEEYYEAAVAAGFGVGCFYYVDVTLEEMPSMTAEDLRALALRNANEFLTWIEGKTFDYPVYLDMEDPSLIGRDADDVQVYDPVSAQILTDMCHIFIRRVQEEGWYCGLYVNKNWLSNYLIAGDLTPYYDIWYARYPHDRDWNFEQDGLPAWLDDAETRMGIWQYSENGVIGDHFSGQNKIDLNVSFKDYPTIIRQMGYNGFSATVSV